MALIEFSNLGCGGHTTCFAEAMTHRTFCTGLAPILALALAACSTSDPATGLAAVGGATSGGGATSAGGKANTGGVSSDGGMSGAAGSIAQLNIAQANLPRTAASAVAPDSLTAAVNANNALAVDLYAHVLAAQPAGNLLTSPISAGLALTMTYAGAVGKTATEMATALHFDPSLGSAIFEGQNALSQALASRGSAALDQATQSAKQNQQPAPVGSDYDLSVVNSVWGEQTYVWEAPFLATLAQSYGTGVYQEDFVHDFDGARVAINDWVSEQTKNKINDLLPQGALDDTTRMVLVNALHLRFPWQSPFQPAATASADFTRKDGSKASASFMNQSAAFAYLDDGQAQVIGLPLYGGQLALVIALPHAGVDLSTYEASLVATSAALSTPKTSALVALALPKVNFTSASVSLKGPLQSMGMQTAFDKTAADFSGLCENPPNNEHLYVKDVLQKAMISLQETGVEAAAATAVVVGSYLSIAEPPPPPPVQMVVNRPYLVALVDQPTGAVLMLGHVSDPTDAGGP